MGQLYVVVCRDFVFERIVRLWHDETLIGRHADCNLRLASEHVSRKHALIFRRDNAFYVLDLSSRNGSYLNRARLIQAARLTQRAELVIGPYQLTIWTSIAQAIREQAAGDDSTCSDGSPRPSEDIATLLTPAQYRVYKLLLEGLIEKEVAGRLGITTNTVHGHAKAIYRHLAVSTRGELIAQWARINQGIG